MRNDRTYVRAGSLSEHVLLAELRAAYERGWQPADVLHVAGRSGAALDVALAATAVLFDARLGRAAERAPADWAQQIDEISARHPRPAHAAGAPALADGLRGACPGVTRFDIEGLAFTWKYLPTVAILAPPPSRWPSVRSADTHRPPAHDPRILDRIRALLSKAESTNFPDEAEALTAKAQELVTRHAVGAALLADRGSGTDAVVGRRIRLDGPYIREKVLLLTAIGDANRVRTVWFTRLQIATAVGTATDLHQTTLLFSSLLVQAGRAVQAAGTAGRRGASAATFRRAFLTGYAHRIGERLREADIRATAEAAADARIPITSLAPILARRSDAVDSEFRRLFPVTRDSRTRGVDADGFHAGRDAAETASLAPEARPVDR
ncbi:DUF2786 domain-containing protein [Rhodococcus sp. CH91]|uniref:DUF2786 domain-containing protein n=1 Tax=Rhodococcus sp. CH91 TaxID=2910256 RepID=UPI001F4A9F31|nr:DUF2786 domain-containing protein [Rhodococcus sp. CH91]